MIKRIVPSLALLSLGAFGGATVASAKAGAVVPAIVVASGTVSANAALVVNDTEFLPDGSFRTPIDVQLNGGHRIRAITVSADGTTVAVDGVIVASPPAVVTAWAAEQPVLATKMAAMFANTSVQSFFTGP